tara:strand:- start:4456 stop:4833 length:378 start_codon:yes stop_codon:yes gene_type:complete
MTINRKSAYHTPLMQKIKDICELEVAVCEDDPPEGQEADGDNYDGGRLDFAEIILELMKAENKEAEKITHFYYNITVPVSETDADDIVRGEELSWTFNTKEDENVHVRVRMIEQEAFNEEEGEIL